MEEGIVFPDPKQICYRTRNLSSPATTHNRGLLLPLPSPNPTQIHSVSSLSHPSNPKKKKEEKKKGKRKRPGSFRPYCSLAWHSPAGSPTEWIGQSGHPETSTMLFLHQLTALEPQSKLLHGRQNKSHDRTKKGRKEKTFLLASGYGAARFCSPFGKCIAGRGWIVFAATHKPFVNHVT